MCVSVSCCAQSHPNPANDHFLTFLPTITRIARRAFRNWNAADREELVHEAIASAYVQYLRLRARGAVERAFATPLGHYGVRHANSGRRVGGSLNKNDVSSVYCRRHRKINLIRLTRPCDVDKSSWHEIVVEDRRSTPAQVAAVRVDFADWISRLPLRQRSVALYLARGEETRDAASRFATSSSRISQIRAELRRSWEAFQEDDETTQGRGRPAKPCCGVRS